jgi:hypothetical protein
VQASGAFLSQVLAHEINCDQLDYAETLLVRLLSTRLAAMVAGETTAGVATDRISVYAARPFRPAGIKAPFDLDASAFGWTGATIHVHVIDFAPEILACRGLEDETDITSSFTKTFVTDDRGYQVFAWTESAFFFSSTPSAELRSNDKNKTKTKNKKTSTVE